MVKAKPVIFKFTSVLNSCRVKVNCSRLSNVFQVYTASFPGENQDSSVCMKELATFPSLSGIQTDVRNLRIWKKVTLI